MTGASIIHNRTAGNVFAELRSKLDSDSFDVFMANMKVQTAQAFDYPDPMVVRDKSDTDPWTKSKPIVIVEMITSSSLMEASMDLGANGFQTFRYVVLPQMATALLAGGMLAFALSFDEVIVTSFTAGQHPLCPSGCSRSW
jgi:hypothetical protein